MFLVTVFTEDERQQSYKSRVLSPAVLFVALTWILNIFLPLALMYQREGIWMKSNTLITQPDISFRHQFILTLDQGQSSPFFLFYSTYEDLNEMMDPSLTRIPYISSYESDHNVDGVKDSLHLKLHLPVRWDEEIVGVNIYLFFQYKIKSTVAMDANYLLLISKQTPVPASGLEVTGDLKLHQKDLIRVQDFRYRSSATDLELLLQESTHFTLSKLLEMSSHKNFSLTLAESSSSMWSRGRDTSLDDFTITLNLNYVTDTFHYRPGIWVVLKWATIQYMALFFLVHLALHRLRRLAFSNNVFSIIDTRLLK